jgi:hypothetical protein
VKWKCYYITIICVHAPAEEKGEKHKDAFYDNLERLYVKVQNNIKIVMRDFNAEVDNEYSYAPSIGKYSLHE